MSLSIQYKRAKRHGQALMKMVRGYENALQTVEGMHEHSLFDPEVLVKTFMGEMNQVIERIFRSETKAEVEAATGTWSPLSTQAQSAQ